ncbi:hypothetical protein Gogos_019438, partial [Gossypium gossypioides]|nr:hypothetical protein [Gossypium gossypioides]
MDESWVCLNMDGSVRPDEEFAAAEGLTQDQNGRWIMGFSKYLGNFAITEAKLWGILDRLKLILDRRFERILIQIDSLEAVNAIQEGVFSTSNSTLLRRIHQRTIQHIPREENTLADSIVKTILIES